MLNINELNALHFFENIEQLILGSPLSPTFEETHIIECINMQFFKDTESFSTQEHTNPF